MRKDIFVLGLDDFNLDILQAMPGAGRYHFHPLLDVEEVLYVDDYDVAALLEKAQKILESHDGPIGGIITHWDFPASVLLPMLCRQFDLPGPSLESVLKCGHKYWSRVEQKKSVPECTPAFALVDPFDPDALEKCELEFPFWVKPIKAWSSQLGFKINNAEDFASAMEQTRQDISRFGEPYDFFLDRVDMPPEVANARGTHCVAEQLIAGVQTAPEGAVFNGRVSVHGIFDMPKTVNEASFARYEYPSSLPRQVQLRMHDVVERLVKHIGFDNSCFNVEFYWDEPNDKLWIIEINPRLSQSHSPLFSMVDGVSNHEIGVSIASGQDTEFEHGQGKFGCAAKFMLHKYQDAVVTRAPTADELETLEAEFEDCRIILIAEEGTRLSELPDQDAYSYVLAMVYLGGADRADMLRRYRELVHRLQFEFAEPANA